MDTPGRFTRALLAATVAMASGATPVLGQHVGLTAPSTAVLEALCAANAPDATVRETCLDIVHTVLAPAAVGEDPHASGSTQATSDAAYTVIAADWDPTTPEFTDVEPGTKLVAFLVSIEGKNATDTTHINILDWRAFDAEGFERENISAYGVEPDIIPTDLRLGQRVTGWVTFAVPEEVDWLEIHNTGTPGEEVYWAVAG